MKNIAQIIKRDFKRLVTTPAALIVALALVVLPSLYAWYNVAGFWNPYDNTGNLKVAVVNLDEGGTTDITGTIDVGSAIVDSLQQNDQLGWVFCGEEEAMEQLKAGDVYAVFVIPRDFTANLLSVTTGTIVKPTIQYYVNEKTGPVAPKITNAGSTVLESTINSTFVQTVSDAVVKTLAESLENGDTFSQKFAGELAEEILSTKESIAEMRASIADLTGSSDATDAVLADARAKLVAARSSLTQLNGALGDVVTDAGVAQQGVQAVSAQLQNAAKGWDNSMTDSLVALIDATARAMDQALEQTANTAQALQLTVAIQGNLVTQSITTLDRTLTTVHQLNDALESTDVALAQIETELDVLYEAVLGASAVDVLQQFTSESGLDLSLVSDFLGSPTQVVTEELWPLNAYGSAMAPLFMNLTFWVGAFMLLVIFRADADTKGLRGVTRLQRYLGRYCFLAVFAILQAAVCCTGIWLMGVQVANLPALYLAAACSSLTYLAIMYALTIVLRNIGKTIALLLVFLQIPGGTGLYPIEMTAPFFQHIYPLLPFTYGIQAMRETIFGFYGANYATALAVLGLFFLVATVCGLVFAPLMDNVNRLFAREIREADIYNQEIILTKRDMSRYERLLRSLTPDELASAQEKAQQAQRVYPVVMKVAVIAGIGIPVALTTVFALTTGEKITILMTWVVSILLMLIAMVVMENWRHNATRAFQLASHAQAHLHDGCVPALPQGDRPENGEDASVPVVGEVAVASEALVAPEPAGEVDEAATGLLPEDVSQVRYSVMRPGYVSLLYSAGSQDGSEDDHA